MKAARTTNNFFSLHVDENQRISVIVQVLLSYLV
jgi:hypothetical protein